MAAEGAGFDPAWLALREPADAAARAADLVPPFAAALAATVPAGAPLRLVDLGAGTGANFRWLAPRLAALADRHQHWRLVDVDPALLARAEGETRIWAAVRGWATERLGAGFAVRAGARCWRVETVRFDLAGGLGALPSVPGEGITAAALLDLVSAAWLDDLAEWVTASTAPILVGLSFDGAMRWRPAELADRRVAAGFTADQRRDKGFGPALGPAATDRLAARLAAAGWRVRRRRSPWRLAAGDPLLPRLVEIVAAGAARDPQVRSGIAAWAERRRAQAAAGGLAAIIGHCDLLAHP